MFITLILKQGAIDIKDFRPSSLVGSTMRLSLKSWLRRFFPLLSRRLDVLSVLDGVLCANGCVDSELQTEVPGVVCETYMEKVYDHVSWKFLDYMLRTTGFGFTWRSWMQKCYGSASFTVFINGSPTVPADICWLEQLDRNSQVFENYVKPTNRVARRANERIYFWAIFCKGRENICERELQRGW